jgi:anion-transporting  ArsA/GET3 family ATPase
MSSAFRRLIERRLLIIMGKGGTGKTTVAATLGTLAARRGAETVVIEVAGAESTIPGLLSGDSALDLSDARGPVEVAPHLSTMRIAPRVALEEYLELRLPVRRLAAAIVHNRGLERFLDAAPGWRELITLGKIWHLEQQVVGGRPRFDVIIVDAPSTGHGLSFLSVPSVVLDSVRMGPLRRHTDAVWRLLRDPKRTLIVPVTLPEELPVKETLELYERIQALGLRAGAPIVNCVWDRPAITDVESALGILGQIPAGGSPSQLAEPALLSAALSHRLTRARLQREFIDKLGLETGSTPLELPYLVEAIEGPRGVQRLADTLESALERADDWP